MATNKKRAAIAASIATLIAIPAEGLRQVAYRDPPGILTVCYGSTSNVVKGKVYTLEECKARLNADMLSAVNEVDKCAPGLPMNVLAAFSDAAYNIGPKVACDTAHSTAARLLKEGKYKEACLQLLKWDKAKVAGQSISLPGLAKRREAEKNLCLQNI